jgi:signal transduction histidine kinase
MNINLRAVGVFLYLLATSAVSPVLAAGHKQVMLLHSFGREMKPWSDYAQGIREELIRQSPWPLDITDHSLVSARYSDNGSEKSFIDYLTALSSQLPPDMIICVGAPAVDFVQRNRGRLFTSTPMLLTTLEQRRVQYINLTQNDAVVPIQIDYKAVIENLLKILPDTRNVAVVNGVSPNEKFWSGQIRKEVASLVDSIEFTFWDNLSFDDILKKAANLPPHSAILWEGMSVDAAGVVHDGNEAFKWLYAVSVAPIFGYTEPLIGQGVVGGPFNAVRDTSRTTAAVVVRILKGEKAGDIRLSPLQFTTRRYDWRELQRWGISESHLPPNSEIAFREATAWDRYRSSILTAFALILVQGVTISGLLFERRRRLHFQVEATRRSAELAHFNRYSTAGELTASLAHELNQPLGAIQTNAETLKLLLKSPAPNLDEICEIVDDIHRDDKRAAGVILRLRNMLKNAPPMIVEADLCGIVRNTTLMLSSYATARKFNFESNACSEPLPIKVDEVQIQQVLVNLIVNAADAMSQVAHSDRTVTISTERDGASAVLSVSDVGPGIPVATLTEIFEPFFTTKREGMGMGLSITRTIIKAHGGQVSAESEAGRGATFRVRLPLLMK